MISSGLDNHKRERRARLLCKAVNLGLLALAVWVTIGLIDDLRAPATDDQIGMDIRVAYDRDCGTLDWDETFHLPQGKEVELKIRAESYWNASGLILEKGATYKFEVKKVLDWKDWNVDANAEGWIEPPKNLVAAMRSLARAPDRNYFYLMGAIRGACYDGLTCEEQFPIGKKAQFTAPANGEFCSFANDIPLMYWNNSGSITLEITRK